MLNFDQKIVEKLSYLMVRHVNIDMTEFGFVCNQKATTNIYSDNTKQPFPSGPTRRPRWHHVYTYRRCWL